MKNKVFIGVLSAIFALGVIGTALHVGVIGYLYTHGSIISIIANA